MSWWSTFVDWFDGPDYVEPEFLDDSDDGGMDFDSYYDACMARADDPELVAVLGEYGIDYDPRDPLGMNGSPLLDAIQGDNGLVDSFDSSPVNPMFDDYSLTETGPKFDEWFAENM